MAENDVSMSKESYEHALQFERTKARIESMEQLKRDTDEKNYSIQKEIFNKLEKVQVDISTWPDQLNVCKSKLKKEMSTEVKEVKTEILTEVKETYMTKIEGRTFKTWIVATMGGCVISAGIIAFFVKLVGGS